MAAILQTMREGAGTQHPEEIINFFTSRLVTVSGIFDKDNNEFLVEESDTPAMSVDVRQGYAFLRKSNGQMVYPVWLKTADALVAITSNSSGNSRIDSIVLYIDLGATANSAISNVAKLIAVEGTPAGSPTAPDSTAILAEISASNPYIVLANVTVDSGETTILDADITDQRANFQQKTDTALKSIVLTPGALAPTTTTGCADVETVEAGTNDVDYKVLDFDAATEENAYVGFVMPDSYDGGTITARFIWTAASGSGDVIWGIKGRCFANDDAIDQAYGTAVTVTDTLITAGDIHISAATAVVTLAGSPAGGQYIQLKVYRDADAGGDTLAADARLLAVKIEYALNSYTD